MSPHCGNLLKRSNVSANLRKENQKGQFHEVAVRFRPLKVVYDHDIRLAKEIDLSDWDSDETHRLFNSAEEKMKAATDMWEKLEEQRAKELKYPNASNKEELLRRRKKQGSGADGETSSVAMSAEEAAEQAAFMRSQIYLFWGNMLFERSQVECKLGMSCWKQNLDAAVERFKLAGASEADISMVLKNHCSMEMQRKEK